MRGNLPLIEGGDSIAFAQTTAHQDGGEAKAAITLQVKSTGAIQTSLS
jgi:hypothetical protein